MTYREPSVHCPECAVPLTPGETMSPPTATQQCPQCRGSFVRHADLARLFAVAQPDREFELATHNDGSERLGCPVCREPMDIAWVEFLRFQSCSRHGNWFATGQFSRLLRYDVTPEGLPDFADKKKHRQAK